MVHRTFSRTLPVVLLWIAVGSTPSTGQVTVFQTLPGDAATYGLAEATVALRGYPGAAAMNPATVGNAGAVHVGFNTDPADDRYVGERWIFGLAVTQVSADVGFDRSAFGYQYKNLDYGLHEGRDANNNPTGSFRPMDESHKLVAARAWTPSLRTGVALNLIRLQPLTGQVVGSSDPDDLDRTTFSLDFGVHYERSFDSNGLRFTPSAGWSLTDFGPRVSFNDNALSDPQNMVMRGGLSFRLSARNAWAGRPWAEIGFHGALSKSMIATDEDGTYGPFSSLVKAWRPIRIRVNPLNEEVAVYEEISVADQLVRHLALDISMLRILTLRLGHIREDPRQGTRRYNSFGIGVDLHYVALDYGSAGGYPNTDFTRTELKFWRVTARIPLGDDPTNFWKVLFGR